MVKGARRRGYDTHAEAGAAAGVRDGRAVRQDRCLPRVEALGVRSDQGQPGMVQRVGARPGGVAEVGRRRLSSLWSRTSTAQPAGRHAAGQLSPRLIAKGFRRSTAGGVS